MLESEETLCPLDSKTAFSLLSLLTYKIVQSFESAVLVDSRAFLVQLNKIS